MHGRASLHFYCISTFLLHLYNNDVSFRTPLGVRNLIILPRKDIRIPLPEQMFP